MKKILLILILFYSSESSAQSSIDFEKFSNACELWGLIKYFHPEKPGQAFDSAFISQVPKMLEARTDDDWKSLMTDWLTDLEDPATRIISSKTQSASIVKSEFLKDSILYVKISGTSHFDDFYGFGAFIKSTISQLEKSTRIIFDLRQDNEIPKKYSGGLNFFFDYYGLNKILATRAAIQYKSIYYSGFKPETGATSGGYTINNILTNALEPGDFEKSGKRVVWIANNYSDLPIVAIAQNVQGKGIILNESEEVTQLLPLTQTFEVSDNLTVKFRTAELVIENGQLPKALAYSATDNPLSIAERLLNSEIPFQISSNQESPQKPKEIGKDTYSSEYPSIGYRVLAAAKIYSVIEMFFPYHQFMDKNWKSVLRESLPEFIAAKNDVEYGLAVAKMYANINDSHGFIQGNKGLDQLQGEAPSPISVDWIENKIVVTRFRNDSICNLNKIDIGDIITKVDGVQVEKLMEKYEVYFSHSNKATIKQIAARLCIRGGENQEGIFTIVDKQGKSRDVKLIWTNSYNKNFIIKYRLDTIQHINKNIGYADLTRMTTNQTDSMFEMFKDTKAIIFDMRGYPNGTAWTIAPRLTEKQNVAVAKFRKNELLSPNVASGDILSNKSYTELIQTIAPTDQWKYMGKTVMLIDQNAQSQSEHTGLFFESVNNTIFIGSQSAGANGDVTNFRIPGNMTLNFSGQGVWHADGRQLQRIGLVPHVLVKPTIQGIRSNKDEVLDKAVEWINENVD